MIETSRLDDYLQALANDARFSGVVALHDEGRPVFSGAYGYAHRGFQVPNQVETRFRLASVSKPFTAAAVLRLVQEGALALDTPITSFLRLGRTRLSATVTIEQLLTMTAGLADWFDEEADWDEEWQRLLRDYPVPLLRENRDFLPLFSGLEPLQPPGAGYAYNNAGYILLGMAVEKAAGLPFPQAMQRLVFAPARMSHTDFAALDVVQANTAEGYIPPEPAEQENATHAWQRNIYAVTPAGAGDGGAVAPAGDVLRFLQALHDGALLDEEHTRKMLTPRVRQDEALYRGYEWFYGYGLEFLLDGNQEVVRWGHTGEESGVSCRAYHYPLLEVDVAILGNQSWCAGEVGWAVHDLLVG
jgi:CubicO group peptidase (beta-lactamase class C family)